MHTLASIFDWLLAASLRATVLTVVVLIVQRLLRHHLSPRWHHALWLPVLLVLLTPVFPESPWSLGSAWRHPAQVTILAPLPDHTQPLTASPLTLPAADETAAAASTPTDWHSVATLAWVVVTVSFLVGGIVSFCRVLRRFKAGRIPVSERLQTLIQQARETAGLRHVPQVWVSAGVSSPAVAGLLRPVLLLPADFEDAFTLEEARLILRHELTHLKRHDLPVNALMGVLIALHWFNPVLWLAFFKVRADREIACDAQVLAHAPHASRVEYGHALLKVESACSPLSFSLGFVGMFQRGGALRARIRSIAVQQRATPLSSVLASLCMLLMTFFGITQAQTADPAPASEPLISLELKVVEIPAAAAFKWEDLPQAKTLPGVAILSQKELDARLGPVLSVPGATVIASPRVLTHSGRQVDITTVVNHPYKGAKDTPLIHPIGLTWKAEPAAMGGGKIRLKTDIHHSELLKSAAVPALGGLPPLRTFDHQTTLELEPGCSAAILSKRNENEGGQLTRLYIVTPTLVAADKDSAPIPASVVPATAPSHKSTSIGKTSFRPGDAIHITSVLRTPEKLSVNFDYELASQEQALICLDTAAAENAGNNNAGTPPPDKRQSLQVAKGKGSGTLHQPAPYSGLSHLTFRHPEDQAAFGSVYFGTAAQAAASHAHTPEDATPSPASSKTIISKTSTRTVTSTGAVEAAAINAKLQNIVIPRVAFKEATLVEAVNFMRTKARELDSAPSDKGIKFLLLNDDATASIKITLDLLEVPLGEMLHYVTELANVKYRIIPGAILIGSETDLAAQGVTFIKSGGGTLVLNTRDGSASDTSTVSIAAGNDRNVTLNGGTLTLAAPQPPGLDLILPEVKLRNTRFEDAIDFIRIKSRELDPAKKGVNILVRAGGPVDTSITLDLKDVPLLEALRYIAELGHYDLKVEAYGVTLQPHKQ